MKGIATMGLAGLTATVLLSACGGGSATTPSDSSATQPPGSASGASSSVSATASSRDTSLLTHDLLSEDFSSGPGVFHTGQTADFRFSVGNGTYLTTATSQGGGVARSFGEYARTAFSVDASVDVVAMTGMGSGDAVGLGCFDAAGKNGYWFVVDPGNRSGAFGRDVNDKSQDPPLATWNTPAAQVGDIKSLRLSSYITSPVGSDVKLRAWVNGVQVPTTATTGGFAGCEGMMLLVVAQAKGAEVRFDNARAVVPGG